MSIKTDEIYVLYCDLKDVIDGDTLRVDVDHGAGLIQRNQLIRLWDLDTPEVRGGTDEMKRFGQYVRDYVGNLLITQPDSIGESGHPRLKIVSRGYQKDSWARLLCDIEVDIGLDEEYHTTTLSQHLIDLGYGIAYFKEDGSRRSRGTRLTLHEENLKKLIEAEVL